MVTQKDRLNEIINSLDETQISEVIDFAEFLKLKREQDFWSNVPEDDEPLSAQDLKDLNEAKEEQKKGETLSFEEVFRNNG